MTAGATELFVNDLLLKLQCLQNHKDSVICHASDKVDKLSLLFSLRLCNSVAYNIDINCHDALALYIPQNRTLLMKRNRPADDFPSLD